MKTAAHEFFPSFGSTQDNLFAVRPGIAAKEAVVIARSLSDAASCLYEDSVIASSQPMTDYHRAQIEAAAVLTWLSLALLDSLEDEPE